MAIGKTIMTTIMGAIPQCNVILYALPDKEGFYGTLGFRKIKTGMARFLNTDAKRDRGFTE
jgi:hypothetical protein